MRDLLAYLDQRMGEASTYASLAVMLTMMHVNVPPGLWQQITLWGAVIAAVLGVLIAEAGRKPAAQVVGDALGAFVGAVRAMPEEPAAPAAAAPVAGLLLAGLLGLGLTACAQPPQTTVAQVAVALTAADQVALAYVDLPHCGAAGASAACSDPATTAKIKGAAQAAYTAVRTAEASGASADLSLAVSAVGALSAVIPAAK